MGLVVQNYKLGKTDLCLSLLSEALRETLLHLRPKEYKAPVVSSVLDLDLLCLLIGPKIIFDILQQCHIADIFVLT